MPTYLDLWPDDVLNLIYRHVNKRAIADTAERAQREIKRKQVPYCGVKSNSRVIYSWINGKHWKSYSMYTDGKSIYSYNLKIGLTEDDEKVLLDYTARGLGYCSQTTSQQVNLARPYVDKVIKDSNDIPE